jgi:HPr kinase/phosphorylase
MSYKVSHLAEESNLHLRLLAGEMGLERIITTEELNRPAMELTGHMGCYRADRIQILGSGEVAFIEEQLENGDDAFERSCECILSAEKVPCLIFPNNYVPAIDLFTKLGNKYNVPIFTCKLNTASLSRRLWDCLEHEFAPRELVHGSLLDVYGTGVLIRGSSGIGKSECALELVTKGHILVADDVVDVRRLGGSILIGSCSPLIAHHMEIRGLGIIDVQRMFGAKSVRPSKRIRMVATLEEWSSQTTYDRLGLDSNYIEILEIKIPHVVIPVRPGRDISTIVEVGALSQNLRSMGIIPSRDLDEKLRNSMKPAKGNEEEREVGK